MRVALESATGKVLESMEEINKTNSRLECPICHLPLTRVHDSDSVGHLAHPPYSRLYMPELCPNMDPNFSTGTSSSSSTVSYDWNLKHVLKQLEGLNSKGKSILKAVFDSIEHERQNYVALVASVTQERDAIIDEARNEAIDIIETAREEAEIQNQPIRDWVTKSIKEVERREAEVQKMEEENKYTLDIITKANQDLLDREEELKGIRYKGHDKNTTPNRKILIPELEDLQGQVTYLIDQGVGWVMSYKEVSLIEPFEKQIIKIMQALASPNENDAKRALFNKVTDQVRNIREYKKFTREHLRQELHGKEEEPKRRRRLTAHAYIRYSINVAYLSKINERTNESRSI